MKSVRGFLRRAYLPVTVFVAVAVIHFAWNGLFPERDPAQDRWLTVPGAADPPWLSSYIEQGRYWLGYCYSLSFAFAAVAIRRYLECRSTSARNFMAGGLTFSGILAATGCFLLGCCGSPMLGVYLSLFGAAFLPLAGPLVAGLTTVLIGASYWWMNHRLRWVTAGADGPSCCVEACNCENISNSQNS